MRVHTPVQAPRGDRVHAVLMSGDEVAVTACRRRFVGWHVATTPVNCRACLARIGEPVEQGEDRS